MEHYLQYTFSITDEAQKDILIALLAEIEFDGFEEKENDLVAYIHHHNLNKEAFLEIINLHKTKFSKKMIQEQNWNAVWESNFQPVIINDTIAIRAHFHQPIKNVQHEIIITPKMSFGTGHHATTYMMAEQLLKIDLRNKTVFDFGTGTGLLTILAEKLNAKSVTAIDNDEWSITNAAENIQQNNCCKIELYMSDHPPLNSSFDILLANINKNIITGNFKDLVAVMNSNGCMILSGLLDEDEDEIMKLASHFQLQHIESNRRDKWLLLQFNKTA